jgi:O-antigen/teichoic acid export membrane protein
MGATLLDSFFNEIRSVIIFTKYSSADLSMYENGKKYPNLIITNINTAISTVLFPAMSNVQSDDKRLREFIKKSIKFSTFILAPLLCGLWAVAPRFASVLLTDKWLPSVPYIQITCCMCIFYPIHTINIQAMNATGKSGKTLRIEIIKKTINIIVLLATMHFGVRGIAIGSLIISLLSTWINAFYSKQFFDYSFGRQMIDIAPFLLISVIMAAVVRTCDIVLGANNWTTLGADVLIGFVVYFTLCKIFKISELTCLWEFIKTVITRQSEGKI